MADITACQGTNCPQKESCYRYTCDKNPWRQSYFVEVPYNQEEENCKEFWPNENSKEKEDSND